MTREEMINRVAEAIRSRPHFASLDHARHLYALIRGEVLEEAAKELDCWGDIYGDNAATASRRDER